MNFFFLDFGELLRGQGEEGKWFFLFSLTKKTFFQRNMVLDEDEDNDSEEDIDGGQSDDASDSGEENEEEEEEESDHEDLFSGK